MAELVYPELSYKIIGILFNVYNELGGGYQERIYQAAVNKEFIKQNVQFDEEVWTDLYFKGEKLRKYRLDFIVEKQIVLELKIRPKYSPRDIIQVLGYLKRTGLKLGILASFNRNNLTFKRILRGKI